MNEIFIEMHHVITEEEYMIWYMSITLEQVSPLGYMKHRQHAQQI